MKEIKILLKNKKSLYITLVLSLIYITPLLIADYEYLDDWERNLYGYGWQHDGRFVATLLGKIWSLNEIILSIYPFSTILSSLILGFTGFLLISIFEIEKYNTIKWSSLLILTSPTFLGNLAFKFDNLPMSLSLLVVVFPFIYFAKRRKFIILSLIGVFISLGLYQSSTTIFLIIGSVYLIRRITSWQWRLFFREFITFSGIFLFAFIAYSVFINLMKLPISHRNEMIFFQPNFIENLVKNYDLFFLRINLLLNSGHYSLLISFFLIICLLGLLNNYYNVKNKFRLFLIVPCVFIIIIANFFLISGVNIFLKETYWDLRTFSGLSFFLIMCLSFQINREKLLSKIARFTTSILIFFSFVLISQFGRLLTYQSQFEATIRIELNQYFKENTIEKLGCIGTLKIAPRNEFIYYKFPLFSNILGSPVGQFSAWTKNVLNANGMLENVEIISVNNLVCEGELIEISQFYYIRKIDDETLIIDFNKNQCK